MRNALQTGVRSWSEAESQIRGDHIPPPIECVEVNADFCEVATRDAVKSDEISLIVENRLVRGIRALASK